MSKSHSRKARKHRLWKERYKNRVRSLYHFKCHNCGEEVSSGEGHFIPPSLGDPGFYSCKKKEQSDVAQGNTDISGPLYPETAE